MLHFIRKSTSTINFFVDISSISLGDYWVPEAILLNGLKLLQDVVYILEEKDQ